MRNLTLTTALLAILAASAAGEIGPQSEVDPEPVREGRLYDPTEVPGKEYSNSEDKDADGNADMGQIVRWEGDGENRWDSIDYRMDVPGYGPSVGESVDFQIDALANTRDMNFLDLISDRVPLLTSFDGSNDVYSARSSEYQGPKAMTNVWADGEDNINATPGALDDVDGLEVWGPDDTDDASMFSRVGDPELDGQRVSIYRYYTETEQYVPYLNTQTLLDAVTDDEGNPIEWNGQEWQFDVDGMLVWDNGDDDVFNESLIETREGLDEVRQDMVLFTVRPIPGIFDGSEIFLFEYGQTQTTFLEQGGLTWNTANDVASYYDIVGYEVNINALEALPEPTTLGMLALGALALARRRN